MLSYTELATESIHADLCVQKKGCSSVKFTQIDITTSKLPKNYIHVFIESGGSIFWPLDKEYVKLLAPDIQITSKELTPFYNSLVEKGIYYPEFRTSSEFTITSHRSTMCGRQPYVPESPYALKERDQPERLPCIPDIMKAAFGSDTAYLSPITTRWLEQDKIIRNSGVDEIWDSIRMEESGDLSGKIAEVAFGYEDRLLLPRVRKYLDEQIATGKPLNLFVNTAGIYLHKLP
jgi:phosphoglycerol transferase MdoB-like AlkP superfamily enzyme